MYINGDDMNTYFYSGIIRDVYNNEHKISGLVGECKDAYSAWNTLLNSLRESKDFEQPVSIQISAFNKA